MLKALLTKQRREMTAFIYQSGKKGKRRGAAAVFGYLLLLIFSVVMLGFMFTIFALQICGPFTSVGLGWFYFAFTGLVATALGVIGSVFTTYSGLYAAKDNDQLLSLPIPPMYILFSRMLGIYLMSFFFEALVMIPAAIVYWVTVGVTVTSVIFTVLIIFILPVFALTLSCLLGYVVALVAPHVKNKSIITALLSLVFIALYYVIYFNISGIMNKIISSGEQVSSGVRTFVYPFYQMGLGAQGELLPFLFFLLCDVALFALVYSVLARSFLRLATSDHTSVHKEYKETAAKLSSVGSALFSKELSRFYHSSVYLLNTGLGALLLIVGAVAALIKGGTLIDTINTAVPGLDTYLPLIACAAVCLILSMDVVTAPSISLEGRSVWIIQSLPINPMQVFAAKIKLHMAVNALPSVLCSAALCVVIKPEPLEGAMLIILPVVFTFLCAQLGLVFNLGIPNLNWSSETAAVKQSMSVLVSMLVNWVIVFGLAIGCYELRGSVSGGVYMLLACALLLLIIIAMHFVLKNSGKKLASL